MYMMAFITLMVALIGAYAQVSIKQATKGFALQTGVVDTMLAWHSTAVGVASKLIKKSTFDDLPNCSLHLQTMHIDPCYVSGTTTEYTIGGYTSAPVCSGSSGIPCVTALPTGYNLAVYSFHTVLYPDTDKKHFYALTFVPPPPTTADDYQLGLLCLPGDNEGILAKCAAPHKQLPLSFNTFYKQLIANKNIPRTSIGIVVTCGASLCLRTQTLEYENSLGGTTKLPFEYPAPPAYVPIGSIGIITEYTPCPTC